MQQIQYACFDAAGNIKTKAWDGKVVAWPATPAMSARSQELRSWVPAVVAAVRPLYPIDGLVRPRFEARAGRVERWRMIHGGVRRHDRHRLPSAPGRSAGYRRAQCRGCRPLYRGEFAKASRSPTISSRPTG